MEEIIFCKKEDDLQKFNHSLKENLILNFSISNCQKGIYYKIEMKSEDHSLGDFDIFETEEIKCEKQNSVIEFSKKLICDYFFNKRQIIFITIRKGISINSTLIYKKYDRITILSSLITSPDSIYERSLKEKEPDSEKIIIKTEKYIKENPISEKISLFDFFKSGLKLSCYISLDFSNGYNPYIIREINNSFETILKNISNIFLNYTLKHSIFLYGLGGKLNIEKDFKEVFNINKNEIDGSINSINKVLDSFNNCSREIIPDNKIYLSPLINKVNEEIYNSHEVKNYNILFILLKENIYNNDIENSIDSIIKSSYLPLTIIIIGVGNNNFEEMNNVFNSIPNCTSNNKIKKYRNNVLFIPLNIINEKNLDNFIESCLKKTVINMMKFYDLIECTPNQIKKGNFENINESFNSYDKNKKNENREEIINIKNSENIIITGNPYNDLNLELNEKNNFNKETSKINFPSEIPEKKYINENLKLFNSINEDSINKNIKNDNEIFSKNEEYSINQNVKNDNEINCINEESSNNNIKNNNEININDDEKKNMCIKRIPSDSVCQVIQINPYCQIPQKENIIDDKIKKCFFSNSNASFYEESQKNNGSENCEKKNSALECNEIKSTCNSDNYKDSKKFLI